MPNWSNLSKQQSTCRVSKQRRWLYYIFMLSLVFIIFIAGEVVIRCVYPSLSQMRNCVEFVNDERNYVLTPNATMRFDGLYTRLARSVIWQTNAQGVRDNKLVSGLDSKSKKIRIATYGDSETFGWCIDLEYTFQKQMERMDSSFEVINFGVPGYNISQIAKHIEKTVGWYEPDLLIYIINPNDFDPPLSFSKVHLNSEVIKRLLFLYNLIKKSKAKKERRSTPVVKKFITELVRIKRFCEKNNKKLIIVFLDWSDSFILKENEEVNKYFLDSNPQSKRVFDLSLVLADYPRVDSHLPKEAHSKLAEFLLRALKNNGSALQ